MVHMVVTAAANGVNEMMGHSLNLLGGSVHFWKMKHNENHHTFTNMEGMDDDIDIKPWMRVHADQQKRYWFHRFQHIYGLLLVWPHIPVLGILQ
jgi:linoleoyl-CoA desaturase